MLKKNKIVRKITKVIESEEITSQSSIKEIAAQGDLEQAIDECKAAIRGLKFWKAVTQGTFALYYEGGYNNTQQESIEP